MLHQTGRRNEGRGKVRERDRRERGMEGREMKGETRKGGWRECDEVNKLCNMHTSNSIPRANSLLEVAAQAF